MKRLLPIVEGDGDLAAVPELARRVLAEHELHDVSICRPHKRGDLPKVLSRFEDFFNTALLEEARILWVLDYDCDQCNDQSRDVARLIERARSLDARQPIEFVFMVQEFETLFLADPQTTRLVFDDIPADLEFPRDPERIRDAKGWLSKARPKGSAYKPTQHQQRLTSRLDIAHLRRSSPSFQRFENALLSLVRL